MNLTDLASLFQRQQQQGTAEQGLGSLYQQGYGQEQWGTGAVMADQFSPAEQHREHQKMLDMQGQAFTPTLNPGWSWGGLDKNMILPGDAANSGPRWYLENI